MDVIEATKQMIAGKKMRRKCWNKKGNYAFLEGAGNITICWDYEPIFGLGVEEVLADDWEPVVVKKRVRK